MATKDALLRELVEPVVTALELELWGIEYLTRGRHATLRIYIEGPEGVTVDDCAMVSRQVSAVLDVEDPIASEYTLEVSSPGMDRPLYELSQFEKYQGSLVEVRLRAPFNGRRKFSGRLSAVEGDEIVVVIDSEEYVLPFETIERAHVVPEF